MIVCTYTYVANILDCMYVYIQLQQKLLKSGGAILEYNYVPYSQNIFYIVHLKSEGAGAVLPPQLPLLKYKDVLTQIRRSVYIYVYMYVWLDNLVANSSYVVYVCFHYYIIVIFYGFGFHQFPSVNTNKLKSN